MILIASSLSLLVIISGMFLLAKTQKENLSNIFRYVSYFVIIIGFLNLFGGGAALIAKKCMKHYASHGQMQCNKKGEGYKHRKHKKEKKHMRICDSGVEKDCMNGEVCIEKKIIMNDQEMTEKECKKVESKDCCKKKMIIKDSVIIKK